MPDLMAQLLYKPGTVTAVSGKVLRHAVYSWKGGERICIAHFTRDLIHNRLGLPRPDWVKIHKYIDMMEEDFVHRQNLRVTVEEF